MWINPEIWQKVLLLNNLIHQVKLCILVRNL